MSKRNSTCGDTNRGQAVKTHHIEPENRKGARTPDTDVGDNKKTILLYSPDLNFCFSLSMLFQDRYNVITTTNLGMLDRLAADYAANLVMVDAVPSEKLIERLDGLRGANHKLPIILLYVYNSREVNLDRAIREHVDSVFYKPFEIAQISKRVEDLLAGLS
jgi:DNA-binding response OmpR family regulator